MYISLNIPVYGSDGLLGHVSAIVIMPQKHTVTGVVVKPNNPSVDERIIPLAHVIDSSRDHIRIDCTQSDLSMLKQLYNSQLIVDQVPDYRNASEYMFWGNEARLPKVQQWRTSTNLALEPNEVLITMDTSVYATNGNLGWVTQLIVNGLSGRIMYLLADAGLLWWHKEVSISAVTIKSYTTDAIRLNRSRQEVEKRIRRPVRPKWQFGKGYV